MTMPLNIKENKIVEGYSKKWDLSKIETVLKIIREFKEIK